jgi:hypothetical protein
VRHRPGDEDAEEVDAEDVVLRLRLVPVLGVEVAEPEDRGERGQRDRGERSDADRRLETGEPLDQVRGAHEGREPEQEEHLSSDDGSNPAQGSFPSRACYYGTRLLRCGGPDNLLPPP